MTIDSINGRPLTAVSVKTVPKATGEGEKVKNLQAPTVSDDSVAITPLTQGIKKVLGENAMSIDNDKVNAIKRAIAEGTHSINVDKVAKKMAHFESSLP